MPKPRPVVCLDDGLLFSSTTAAGRYYKLSSQGIARVASKKSRECYGRYTANGREFRYVEELPPHYKVPDVVTA